MTTDKKLQRAALYYATAKVVFWLLWPYRYAKEQWAKYKYNEAVKEAEYRRNTTGRKHYVVICEGRFYVLNKGNLLNIAKKIKKQTKQPVQWHELYAYATK